MKIWKGTMYSTEQDLCKNNSQVEPENEQGGVYTKDYTCTVELLRRSSVTIDFMPGERKIRATRLRESNSPS